MNRIFYCDISALFVFIILLGTILYKRLFKGKQNFIFFVELIVCTFTCFFNLLGTLIFYFAKDSYFLFILAHFSHYFYLALRMAILPIALIYIFSSVGIFNQFIKRTPYFLIFITILLIPYLFLLDNCFSHKFFSIDSRLHLIYGNNYNILYLFDCIWILLISFSVLFYRKFLMKSKLLIVILMTPILLTVLFFEYYFPDHQIILFIYSMITYLVSITSQRPELLINSSIGIWSENSYYNEINKSFLLNKESDVILIKILNYNSLVLYLGRTNYISFVRKVASRLSFLLDKLMMDDNIYYLEDFTFAVCLDNADEQQISLVAGEIFYELSEEILFENIKILLNPLICIAKLPDDISNYNSLKYFSKSFHHILSDKEGLVWLSNVKASKAFIIKSNINNILNRAIKDKKFEVYYQPIFSLKENRFICAEALLRLNDEEYGNIPPAIFLPPAEANGAILQLGDFVLDEVCKFIASEEFNRLDLQFIEINLAMSQCAETNLVSKIMSALNKYNISPSKIRLSVTENIIESNPSIMKEIITSLTEKGVFFALDNYGVGYSNIRTVIQLPFSLIKLDKSFVHDVTDDNMLLVLKDLIKMLKVLHKDVLVEGIENESTVKIFSELQCDLIQGCEYVQGFYYSKPLKKNDFMDFINNINNPRTTLSF